LRNGVKPFTGSKRVQPVARAAEEEAAAPAEAAPAAVVEADSFTFNYNE